MHSPSVGGGASPYWNDEPGSNRLACASGAVVAAASGADGRFLPTRVGGTRAIDYLVSCASVDFRARLLTEAFSDHWGFECVCSWPRVVREQLFFVRPTGAYVVPTRVSPAEWVAECYSALPGVPVFEAPGSQPTTEIEWHAVNKRLEKDFARARAFFGSPALRSCVRVKGSPVPSTTLGDFGKGRDDAQGFRGRRFAKLLGRIRERRRVGSGPAAQHLSRRITQSWPPCLPWREDWEVVEEALRLARQDGMRARLQQWRRRMTSGGRYAHQWLKCRSQVVPQSLCRDGGPASRTPGESLLIRTSLMLDVLRPSSVLSVRPCVGSILRRRRCLVLSLLPRLLRPVLPGGLLLSFRMLPWTSGGTSLRSCGVGLTRDSSLLRGVRS